MQCIFLGSIHESANYGKNRTHTLELIRCADIFLTCHVYQTYQPIFSPLRKGNTEKIHQQCNYNKQKLC